MNVVYASNDAYAMHLGVSMYSLFDRNQEVEKIEVWVLSMAISEENQENLKKIADQYRRRLNFVELADLKQKIGFEVETGAYDISIMLRLFVGEALPESIEKVLYLDCDTVVAQPLRHLWKTELHENVIGAVMEPTIYPEVKASIGLDNDEPYFNSGVLLINLKKWREEGVQQRLLDFWKEKGGKLFASDQDVINGGLKGQIQMISPRYNFFTNYRYFSYQTLVRHEPAYRAVKREQLTTAKRHPAIIHYMGDERPWIAGNRNHYRKAYEFYLEKTPWAGSPKEKGKERYMLAYHLMDYVTAVCPAVRWAISRQMGMKFVENRKRENKK